MCPESKPHIRLNNIMQIRSFVSRVNISFLESKFLLCNRSFFSGIEASFPTFYCNSNLKLIFKIEASLQENKLRFQNKASILETKFRIWIIITSWKRSFTPINEHVILQTKDIFNKETKGPNGLPELAAATTHVLNLFRVMRDKQQVCNVF